MTIESRSIESFACLRVEQCPLGSHVGDLCWIVNLQNHVIGAPAAVKAFQTHIEGRTRCRAGRGRENRQHLLVSSYARVLAPKPAVFIGMVWIHDVPKIDG